MVEMAKSGSNTGFVILWRHWVDAETTCQNTVFTRFSIVLGDFLFWEGDKPQLFVHPEPYKMNIHETKPPVLLWDQAPPQTIQCSVGSKTFSQGTSSIIMIHYISFQFRCFCRDQPQLPPNPGPGQPPNPRKPFCRTPTGPKTTQVHFVSLLSLLLGKWFITHRFILIHHNSA